MTIITFTKKRKEKMSKYCNNCGYIHEGDGPLTRIEKDYDGREYEIEICKVARYENTISESKGSQTSTMG